MRTSFNFFVLPYVPNRLVWAFLLSLIEFYALMTLNFWLLVPVAVLVVITLTTQYAVEINVKEKWYKEYVWMLGVKRGEPVKYSSLDYLFINKGTISQTTGSRIQSTTVTRDEYRGFIKFDSQEKIHAFTGDSYESLVKKMSPVANNMNVPLIDYSTGQGIRVV